MRTAEQTLLARQQPIAWKTLSNALARQTFAHAYLFQGPAGTAKKEMALLFAQSVFCPHAEEGIACGQCDTCRRVAALEYADLSYIDGSETTIKKADILRLQENFSRTSLETSPYRIYIMDHAENATADALNSLLKFLEEPQPGIIAVLISDQPELLLATIVSRCQCIPFHPLNQNECLRLGMEEGDGDEMDVYFLSRLRCHPHMMREISENEDYQHARYVFFALMERFVRSKEDAVLFLQTEGYPSKNKKANKTSFRWLLELMIIYLKDCGREQIGCQDSRYVKLWESRCWSMEQLIAMMQIVLKAKDALRRPVNLQLLADQMMYELKEVRS